MTTAISIPAAGWQPAHEPCAYCLDVVADHPPSTTYPGRRASCGVCGNSLTAVRLERTASTFNVYSQFSDSDQLGDRDWEVTDIMFRGREYGTRSLVEEWMLTRGIENFDSPTFGSEWTFVRRGRHPIGTLVNLGPGVVANAVDTVKGF